MPLQASGSLHSEANHTSARTAGYMNESVGRVSTEPSFIDVYGDLLLYPGILVLDPDCAWGDWVDIDPEYEDTKIPYVAWLDCSMGPSMPWCTTSTRATREKCRSPRRCVPLRSRH